LNKLTALQERRIIISVNDSIVNIANEFNTTSENINKYRKELCSDYIPVEIKTKSNKQHVKTERITKNTINKKKKPSNKISKQKTKKKKVVKSIVKKHNPKVKIKKKKLQKIKLPMRSIPIISKTEFKSHNTKYISLMDWGFCVRKYKKRKTIVQKSFRYSHYKTALDCLYAAMEWRDLNLVSADFSRPLKTKPMPSNKLQIAGVYKTFIYRKYQKTEYYRAFWTEDKKQKCRYFNIDRLGKKEALKLAVACRNEAVQRINGKVQIGGTK